MLETVNRHFYASTESDRFATLFFGAYNDRSRKLRYVNCGHCAPLLLREGGELELLDPTAMMLGAFEEWSCTEAEVELRADDSLLLYSDGVTEAASDRGDEFGEERLVRALRECGGKPADAVVREIVDAVTKFGGVSRTDDVTIVAIRGIGGSEPR
jgi:sigma-B regulation protein RsbU (phosphoserine phosphatase)